MEKTVLTQDNERDSFSAIGLAALLIVNRLKNDAQLRATANDEDCSNPDSHQRTGEAKEERGADSEYVRQRLRELAAFEKRASGK